MLKVFIVSLAVLIVSLAVLGGPRLVLIVSLAVLIGCPHRLFTFLPQMFQNPPHHPHHLGMRIHSTLLGG